MNIIKKFFKIVFLLGVLTGFGIFGWLLYLYSQIRFDIKQIVDYKPKLTTQFFDKNGVHIGNIFKGEHRIFVKYQDIPPRITEALVAIEDTNFFEHDGINYDAILRAVIKDVQAMKLVEGASTLTQQLIKTMILTRDKKLIRKIKEALLSLRLETLLTKEEILERYLNHVYFGHGYYGIKTAAKGYFHKELPQLTLKEVALLVGLPRAPSFYDPTRNLKYSLIRANQVINRMQKLGWINEDEYRIAINEIPTIYDDTLTLNRTPYLLDHVIKQLKNNVSDLYTGGYKITLTADFEAQKIAKEALKFSYERIKQRDPHPDTEESTSKTLNGAMVVLENKTGAILAMVGGLDYKDSNFNRATQSIRQPGSSIKPFIYQVALDLGYSTASSLKDIARNYRYTAPNHEEKTWQPRNYEKNFKGLIPFREALVHSRNLATINLVNDIGLDLLYKELHHYGFKDIPYNLSITLGSFGISPIEFSEKYTIFSNGGIMVKPYLIYSIEDRNNDKIVFEKEEQYITSPEQTYLMTSILQDVVQRGTGRKAKVKGIEIAGKTGTTNNNVDAWFCGFSPTIQTVVWFGNDDNTPMYRAETGGRAAGPAFQYFFTKWLDIHPEIPREFTKPKDVFEQMYGGRMEIFTKTSKVPQESSDIEIQNEYLENKGVIF
jgi:penicillin-binding protein 1A